MENKPIAMRDALLERIWESMGTDDRIYFVTADFGSPVLDKIRADFPDRFKNVGIAEQNLINVSTGLALEGFKVFAYAIAPFITMRCYEQLRVCLSLLSKIRTLNVNLIGVGAGYSYVVSGPTHQCYEDITLIRSLVKFQLFSPSDFVSAAALFEKCISSPGPKYIRLDAQVLPQLYTPGEVNLAHGYNRLRQGQHVCMIATGYMVHTALKVAQKLDDAGITASVIDLFDIEGFDEDALIESFSSCRALVSMEEGFEHRGGLDARMAQCLQTHGLTLPLLGIGVEADYRFELGKREQLHEQVGIGTNAAFSRIQAFCAALHDK